MIIEHVINVQEHQKDLNHLEEDFLDHLDDHQEDHQLEDHQ